MSWLRITGSVPMGERPDRVDQVEQLLFLWFLGRLGMSARYDADNGVAGIIRRSGSERPGQVRRFVTARQALDGRWYVRQPEPRDMVGWLSGGTTARVDLAAERGHVIAFGGRQFTVPAAVELGGEDFPAPEVIG